MVIVEDTEDAEEEELSPSSSSDESPRRTTGLAGGLASDLARLLIIQFCV